MTELDKLIFYDYCRDKALIVLTGHIPNFNSHNIVINVYCAVFKLKSKNSLNSVTATKN